jgi:two-component system, cell cycle response regulator DivK
MATILVVEDDSANQELLTRFLRRAGYSVLQALDGLAGVKAAQESSPDLIVMDLGLPELDGWESAQRIRSNPATARIPIIALTAHTMAEDVSKALSVGFDACETKPVVYVRLIRKIAGFLERAPRF